MAHRSWLFVPGDSPAKLAKIATCGADAVIIDLEDSVAPAAKIEARIITQRFLANWEKAATRPAIYVRINGLKTGLAAADLSFAVLPATTGIMLPKAEGGVDVSELAAMLRVEEARAALQNQSIKIIAIATETAHGVLQAGTYQNASARLVALAWGAEDLSADIGAQSAMDQFNRFTPLFTHARTMVLLGAAGASVAAIDGIYANFRDDKGLETQCQEAFRDGFTGKMAIHPAQIPIINRAFTPSAEAIAQARQIVDAFAHANNAGVVSFNGRMLDRPHLKQAEQLLARSSQWSSS